VRLEEGSIVVRSLGPEDAPAYTYFISRIDEGDLRRRFPFLPEPGLDRDPARYMQIDCDRDIAFVAVRQSEPGRGEIVGEVRAHRYTQAPTAELGIIVRSDMKRRGVGRALMEAMIAYSKDTGLELIAQIAPDNESMIVLAERSGMQIERSAETDIVVAHVYPEEGLPRRAELL